MGIISNQENSFAIIHESPSGFVVNVKYDEKRIEKINLKVLRWSTRISWNYLLGNFFLDYAKDMNMNFMQLFIQISN